MLVFFVSRDLMFQSRVRAQVQSAGMQLMTATDPVTAIAKLIEMSGEKELPVLQHFVIDLKTVLNSETRTQDLTELRQAIADFQTRQTQAVNAIAYGPHVNHQLLQSATDAGFASVMTQGQFDRQFSQVLNSHFS